MGQYYQPPPPGYGAPQYAPEPPEAGSIKSMLNIAGILALIFGILLIIVGAITLIFLFGIIPLIFGIVDLLIYMNCKEISQMIDSRQYEAAKSKTLVWMVLGFILGGLLIGILLLIAYLKFDTLINASRAPQGYGYMPPPPGYQQQYQQPGYRQCMGCGQQIPANSWSCPYCGRQG